jgi:hypothetical protein
MEYSVGLTTDLPRYRVVELFDEPDNLPKRKEGLRSLEHVNCEPRQPGDKF